MIVLFIMVYIQIKNLVSSKITKSKKKKKKKKKINLSRSRIRNKESIMSIPSRMLLRLKQSIEIPERVFDITVGGHFLFGGDGVGSGGGNSNC